MIADLFSIDVASIPSEGIPGALIALAALQTACRTPDDAGAASYR